MHLNMWAIFKGAENPQLIFSKLEVVVWSYGEDWDWDSGDLSSVFFTIAGFLHYLGKVTLISLSGIPHLK